MICSKCGKAYDDYFTYCPYCGEKTPEKVKQEKRKEQTETVSPREIGGFVSPPWWKRKREVPEDQQWTPVSLDPPVSTINIEEEPTFGQSDARSPVEQFLSKPLSEKELLRERGIFIKVVLGAIGTNLLLGILLFGPIHGYWHIVPKKADVLGVISAIVSFAVLGIVIYATARLGAVIEFTAKQWLTTFVLFLFCYWLSFLYVLSESKPDNLSKRLREDFSKSLHEDHGIGKVARTCPKCGNSIKAGAIWCNKCGAELSQL